MAECLRSNPHVCFKGWFYARSSLSDEKFDLKTRQVENLRRPIETIGFHDEASLLSYRSKTNWWIWTSQIFYKEIHVEGTYIGIETIQQA